MGDGLTVIFISGKTTNHQKLGSRSRLEGSGKAGPRDTPDSPLVGWPPGADPLLRGEPNCGCSLAMLHLSLPMSRGVRGPDEHRMHNGNRQQRQAIGCEGRERGRKASASSLQNRDDLVTSDFLRTKQGHLGVFSKY